ncbi:MAG: nickel-dependent hydrogenase large subunit [Thermoanaerobaculaceae bacterium]
MCGVCTTVHALASVRGVEDALGVVVPPSAEIVRNIMELKQYLQDHVIHFYHLRALDWVDVVSALRADPKAAAELAQKVSPHVKRLNLMKGKIEEAMVEHLFLPDLAAVASFPNGRPLVEALGTTSLRVICPSPTPLTQAVAGSPGA